MNNIKLLRVEKGLSQEQLAKEAHVTQTAVSQWEVGRTAPDKDIANLLADFFGVSLDYLLGRTSDRNNSYIANNISGSNIVQGNGSVLVGENFSKEETELLRIYRALDVRGRAKLLNSAFALEDESKGGD
ncbi:MAG: helix-turn-helix domain-containing protein [Ruminococcus sp.]|nr:helix-turn-helix domain-containing protein [Ruminococcus sp.]